MLAAGGFVGLKYGAAVGALLLGGAPGAVGTPKVTGPRATSDERPVYRFRAAHAVGFRCAFDTRALHWCASRYSERLAPGAHVLRVRALGRKGAVSRIVSVRVSVTVPYPALAAGRPIEVGAGAGVPAAGAGSVWVPLTDSGELARVDSTAGTVTAKLHAGQGAAGRAGFLDAAVVTAGWVWQASDAGGTIARVDAASGAVANTFSVGNRPGGLTVGDGSVWAFSFLGPDATQIDAATGTVRRVRVEGVSATGIAYGAGSLWLLSTGPSRIVKIDPRSGAVLATYELHPPYAAAYALIENWWLAFGDGAVWATLPNYGAVARLDVATGALLYARTPYGRPFGVAAGGGSAWVATDHGVLRLDATTGKPTGVALLPTANRSGFASITYGDGAAWFTNYDRGTLTRVAP